MDNQPPSLALIQGGRSSSAPAQPARHITSIQACTMPLYPTKGSPVEAVEYITSQLPGVSANEVFTLLMVYHNTLIQELEGKHLDA